MAQQTAVQWLMEEYIKDPYDCLIKKGLFEQAISIEKEQHGNTWDEAIDAHEKRGHVIARSLVDFDDYYNETFNK